MSTAMTWADFGKTLNHVAKSKPTAFSTPLGSYFTVGKHRDVKIIEVSPAKGANAAYLKVRFENNEGATIQTNIFLEGRDRDGKPEIHYRYKQLLGSFCPNNPALALDYHAAAVENPALFGGLVGLKTTIEVKEGTDGYVIDKFEDGYILRNKETDMQYEGTGVYNTVAEAKEAAKELNIYACRPNVGGFFQASKLAEDTNAEALRLVVSNAAASPSTGNKTGNTVRRNTI